ncbi:MAG: hypothetical protein ACTSRA_19075, partial [Promethearchaeota archaeon]
EYADPTTTNGSNRGTLIYFCITIIIFSITGFLYLIFLNLGISFIDILFEGFYSYSLSFGAIAVAFLTALIVGNVNEDVWRLYLKGYHVHESIIGLYFSLIGGPLLLSTPQSLEFIIGLAFIIAGIFLIGRDWKDVVKGNLLVHRSKEPDYEIYKELKDKKNNRVDSSST